MGAIYNIICTLIKKKYLINLEYILLGSTTNEKASIFEQITLSQRNIPCARLYQMDSQSNTKNLNLN